MVFEVLLTGTSGTISNATTSPLIFGANSFDFGNRVGVDIDELRIWTESRSESDINDNMFNELNGDETNLVAYYNFSEGIPCGNNTGITGPGEILDQTANAHHGTMVNFNKNTCNSNWIDGSENGVEPEEVDSEINIQGNSIAISDGDDTPVASDDTDFGTVTNNKVNTFTIQNTGISDLEVSTIVVSGTNASDFVVGGITLPATVAPSGSTTFTVTFTPLVTGTHTANIAVHNSDTDETIYDFAVQG